MFKGLLHRLQEMRSPGPRAPRDGATERGVPGGGGPPRLVIMTLSDILGEGIKDKGRKRASSDANDEGEDHE